MSEGAGSGGVWRLWEDGAHGAAWNMASDELLLDEVVAEGRPILRFYGWTEPAATFGYSQRWAEVQRWTALRPLIRRPTGGGLVPHDRGWTYTLAFPSGHAWHQLRARESYARVHSWLQRAFARTGWRTELARSGPGGVPGACFSRAETSDVLSGGTKVAGAAQRRTRGGLLIQGAVAEMRSGAGAGALQSALVAIASEEWGVTWERWAPTPEYLARVTALEAAKYGLAAHNARR